MHCSTGEYHWVADLMIAMAEICEDEGQVLLAAPLIRAIEEIAPMVHASDRLDAKMTDIPFSQNVIRLDAFRRACSRKWV